MTPLDEIHSLVIQAVRRSSTGSYRRRAPSPESVPLFEDAKRRLDAVLAADSGSLRAWRLLAQVEECLLRYDEARRCVERAMDLAGRRDRKDLQKLAEFREAEKFWADVVLNPYQCRALEAFLRSKLDEEPGGRSLRWTEEWLRTRTDDPERVLDGLRRHGGYSDVQVLFNVLRG
jgi:hypothetical protein